MKGGGMMKRSMENFLTHFPAGQMSIFFSQNKIR